MWPRNLDWEPKGGSHEPGEQLPWVQESTEAKPSSPTIRQVQVWMLALSPCKAVR